MIYKWSSGEKEISIYRQGNQLKYRISDSSEEDTIVLIDQTRVERTIDLIQTYCFAIRLPEQVSARDDFCIPILSTRDALTLKSGRFYPITNLRIALYADFEKNRFLNIKKLAWVVFAPSQPLKIIEETRYLEKNVLKGLLKKKFSDQSPTYLVSNYIQEQQLRVLVECNSSNELEQISLKKICGPFSSRFDHRVILDDNHWAITLLSSNTHSSLPIAFTNLGHSMLGYEGVENGKRFFKVAHITTVVDDGQEPLLDHEAYIIIKDKTYPLDGNQHSKYHHSPTWIRSKLFVENMIHSITKEEKVKFLISGHKPQGIVGYFSNWFYKDRLPFHLQDLVTNCRDWTLAQLEKAGIHISLPKDLSPHEVIDFINNHPECIQFFRPAKDELSYDQERAKKDPNWKKLTPEEKIKKLEEEKSQRHLFGERA